MAADKALQLFAGEPLVAHALTILRQAGLPGFIAGARSPLGAFAPVVEDWQPGMGPLGGICAALAATSACRAVFLPVDLPLLPASLLIYLLHHARITGRAVTLASVNGFAQTFPVVVGQEALPVLRSELEAGRKGCFSAFQAAAARLGQPLSLIPLELLLQTGHLAHPGGLPAVHWFLNVNTPEDLRRAERLHSGFGGAAGLACNSGFACNSNFARGSDSTAPVPMKHHAKRYIFSPTGPAFPLQYRGINKNGLSAGWASASSATRAGAGPNIRRRAASLALNLQISGAPRIGGRDPE
jgi:molybdopterin-guanine dinucleotide biosynthesis protein A